MTSSQLHVDKLAPEVTGWIPHECHKLVSVVSEDDEETLKLAVRWRQYRINLDRKKTDRLGDVLARFALHLQKQQNRQKAGGKRQLKKQRKAVSEAIDVEETTADAEQDISGASVESLSDADGANDDAVVTRSDVALVSPDGTPFSDSAILCEAMQAAKSLRIRNDQLTIVWNPPRVIKLSLSGKTVVGLPCVAMLEKAPQASSEEFLIEWRVVDAATDTAQVVGTCPGSGAAKFEDTSIAVKVGRWYIPSEVHLGKKLLVRGFSKSMPCLDFTAVTGPIEQAWERCWRDVRLEKFARGSCAANDVEPDIFRVASFNILADIYARTPLAREVLFPYCPDEVVTSTARNPRIAAEILQLDCDVVCLQECASNVFVHCIRPLFEETYYLRFTEKKSKAREGCATFVSKSKYSELEHFEFDFKGTLVGLSSLAPLVEAIKQKWPGFIDDVLPHMTAIYQLAVLESLATKHIIILGNTHFFFHPSAGYIRLLQAFVLLQCVAALFKKYQQAGKAVAVVLAGDFNATPTSGAYELFTTGRIAGTHPDWELGPQMTWSMFGDRREEELESAETGTEAAADTAAEERSIAALATESANSTMHKEGPHLLEQISTGVSLTVGNPPTGAGFDLQVPSEVSNLLDVYSSNPHSFTNFVNGFCGTLDHIFVTSSCVKVERLLDPITIEDATRHGGLPSLDYPSDHVSIAAELSFRS